jgi:hypothetical protein
MTENMAAAVQEDTVEEGVWINHAAGLFPAGFNGLKRRQ